MNARTLKTLAAALAPGAREVLIRDDNPRGPATVDVLLDGASEAELDLVRRTPAREPEPPAAPRRGVSKIGATMKDSWSGMFFPRIVGVYTDTGTATPTPDAYQTTRTSAGLSFPCVESRALDATSHMWLELPGLRDGWHAYSPFGKFNGAGPGPNKLKLWTQGIALSGTLTRPTYQVRILRPAVFTPNTPPNSPDGTFDGTSTASDTLSSLVTDAHAANGGDWTSIIETTIDLTDGGAPGTLPLSTTQWGEVLLYVTLPFDNNLGASFRIIGGAYYNA